MKRSLIALTLAAAASVAFAGSDEYRFNAGEQDLNTLKLGEAGNQYRFDAGEQDGHVSIADAYRFDAGQKDEHEPKVG